jgi:glutamyl-tRNA synthetase
MLIKSGHAYYCFCDSSKLEDVKLSQEENKDTFAGYDRHCRSLNKSEIEESLKNNKPHVIRFKTPLDGKTLLDDVIFKRIEFENKLLQDIVLLKTDGFPTYHLANVVDDKLMEITHVLRGQEWIPTSPYHVMLYKAFGWEAPKFCHLPLIVGEDGQKLSKRHGATQVREFKNQGYLPEALINFVMLLGWSFNDSQDLFTPDDLKKVFTLERINKASAVFNYGKLKWFNGQYIRKKSIAELLVLILPYYIDKGLISKTSTNDELDYLKKIIPLIQERMELLTDAPQVSDFMFGDLPEYKTWEAIFPKNVDKETIIKILQDSKEILKEFDKRDHKELHDDLYKIAAKYNVKAGAVFMPIRIAVTGINKSPELFPVMEVLGIERVLKRIDNAIKKLEQI